MQQPGWQADPSRSVERSAGKLKYDLEMSWSTHNRIFGWIMFTSGDIMPKGAMVFKKKSLQMPFRLVNDE